MISQDNLARSAAKSTAADVQQLKRPLFRSVAAAMALLATLLIGSSSSFAASSATLSQDGVSLTLVALAPGPDGQVRGALQIDLDPGWKTYWIAPGPVGLAPHLDFGASTGIEPPDVFYPVPHRFREGADVSVGFEGLTAFAFEAQADGDQQPMVRLDLLIGVCRDICVPVSAKLETPLKTGLSAQAAVLSAFSALPQVGPAPPNWDAELSEDGDMLRISIPREEAGASSDIYLVGPDGWSFGSPLPRNGAAEGGRALFEVPVVARPVTLAKRLQVDVLLTSGQNARLSRSLDVELP